MRDSYGAPIRSVSLNGPEVVIVFVHPGDAGLLYPGQELVIRRRLPLWKRLVNLLIGRNTTTRGRVVEADVRTGRVVARLDVVAVLSLPERPSE